MEHGRERYIYIHISPEQKQDIVDDLRLSGTITIDGEGDNEAAKQPYERNEMEIVNNYAPFTEFINNANKVKKTLSSGWLQIYFFKLISQIFSFLF